MAGIYIHIPFCAQACHYCDFHFSTNLTIRNQLIQAIGSEIILQKDYLGNEIVNTIYFGGGTPSLLTQDEVTFLLNTIRLHFDVSSDAEITLEANPDDLSLFRLEQLLKSGINRLSIGIQSFNDTVLKFLNRTHDAKTAKSCILEAKNVGFDNISIDLIFAIPDQHEEIWISNLEQTLALDPAHISAYSLTIEEKTAFGKWAQQGRLRSVNDDMAAKQMDLLIDILELNGYEHYEISNFSKPGFHSRHNSNYWKQEKYLGVGPSAHSFNGITRQHNANNNPHYVKALNAGKIPFEVENLTLRDKTNDYILTSLRTIWGCDTKKLFIDYHTNLLVNNATYIHQLLAGELAILDSNAILKLTRKGKLLADKISSDLFV